MPDSHAPRPTEVDPRRALAQKYLQKAHAELEAKDKEKPRQRHTPGPDEPTRLSDALPSIDSLTFMHLVLLIPLSILAGLACAWCYGLLGHLFVLGRIVAFPVGILLILTLSYLSAFYLGVIESTANGRTNPEDSLRGDWRDWFWSLPMTLGMLLLAGIIGYVAGLASPTHMWQVIGVGCWLFYPVLLLSSLEKGSPTAPISVPIMRTLFSRPLMWMSIYAITFALNAGAVALSKAVYREPPYLTICIMAPIVVLIVFSYGLILGTAARWLSLKGR